MRLPHWPRRGGRRLPLRVTLVAAMLGLVTMALIVIGVAGSTLLQRYLLDRVDNQLRTTAAGILSSGGQLPDNATSPVGSYYVGLADSSGVLLNGSRVVHRMGDPNPSPPKLASLTSNFTASHDQRPFTVGAASGSRHWRVYLVALSPSPTLPTGGSLIVAFPLDDVNNTVGRLIAIDAVVSVIVLLLLAGIGYFLVRGSLRPLVEVERTAEAIAAGDLSLRVDEDSHTEVGRLGASLNTMLGQIEDAFRARERSEMNARASEERMRQFVADAGHELRTPLTSVRGFAELYRLGAVSDEVELNRVMKRIEDEAQRMGVLVEDLLLLARLDQQRPLERVPVELMTLATEAVSDLHDLHPDRPVRLVTDQPAEPPVVIGDENRLRQVLGNLLANAVTHTPAGTAIKVTLLTEGPYAVLAVSDQGPGMRPEDTARVFERFFRADPSRVRSSGGSGLGLSIVAALVAAHGGHVQVESTLGQGTTFTVRIPLMGAFPPPPPGPPPAPGASNTPPGPNGAPSHQGIHSAITR